MNQRWPMIRTALKQQKKSNVHKYGDRRLRVIKKNRHCIKSLQRVLAIQMVTTDRCKLRRALGTLYVLMGQWHRANLARALHFCSASPPPLFLSPCSRHFFYRRPFCSSFSLFLFLSSSHVSRTCYLLKPKVDNIEIHTLLNICF